MYVVIVKIAFYSSQEMAVMRNKPKNNLQKWSIVDFCILYKWARIVHFLVIVFYWYCIEIAGLTRCLDTTGESVTMMGGS